MKLFSILLLISTSATAWTYFDDFEDNDISDWEARGNPAYWDVDDGMVFGSTPVSVCEMVPVDFQECRDVAVQIYVTGVHDFGVCARYDQNDSGIVAYVSPDHDVARIRSVGSGTPGEIYNSLYADFPSGVWYHLTLTCSGPNLLFQIQTSGEYWEFTAIDPDPEPGVAGLHMAEESSAYWDWFSATPLTSIGGQVTGSTDVSFSASPNPVTTQVSFALQYELGSGTVSIYDLSGSKVTSLPFMTQNGNAEISWDLRDTHGMIIPSGVYLARIDGSDHPPVRLVRIH